MRYCKMCVYYTRSCQRGLKGRPLLDTPAGRVRNKSVFGIWPIADIDEPKMRAPIATIWKREQTETIFSCVNTLATS